jgi:non-ribosomal peptide synthetase component E (peptide arylation enzyme)
LSKNCVKFLIRMLLRLSRSSSTVQLTFKRFNSSVRTSFAVKESSLSSSSHQTTRDDHSTLAIFENALRNNSKIAVKDHNAEYTYKQLLTGASKISEIVSALCEPKSRVSYLVPNEILYSAVQYGLWMNSNTAIPLSPLHPSEVLEYSSQIQNQILSFRRQLSKISYDHWQRK